MSSPGFPAKAFFSLLLYLTEAMIRSEYVQSGWARGSAIGFEQDERWNFNSPWIVACRGSVSGDTAMS